MKFTITPKAAQAINKHVTQKEAGKNAGLRLGIRSGGCKGYQYVLHPENVASSTDNVINQHDAKVYVDLKSATFLDGCKLDWVGGLMESGFKITKPNEQIKTCGCGESFGDDI